MKKTVSFLLTLFSILTIQAQTVNPEEATALAINFFNERLGIHHSGTITPDRVLNIQEISADGSLVMYAVNFAGGGYALVSASRYTFPVLGYNLSGEYMGIDRPENYQAWMRYLGRQITFADESGVAAQLITAARQRWSVSADNKLPPISERVVEPMLRTTWDQGNYYNALCPADAGGPGGHCWAGCVATAVGQLMFHHRWPNQGLGSYSYTHPDYGELSASFGETSYNWNGMETTLTGPNNNLALLLYHLGISFDMDYGPDGSGMWNHSAANSMRNFFKYGAQTQYIFRDSTHLDWDSILVANLDARKPLYYAGWEGVGSLNGHAFVCDGYAPDNFYHFNWGWSNAYDGYFLLSALTPGGNNFNFAQEVIRDIYPDTLLYSYPEFCTGPDTLSAIAGTFSDGSNMVNYLNNSDCFWLVQPNEPDFDSITSINLDFPLVDLAGTDRIRIYQGPDTTAVVLAEITGTVPPATLSIPGSPFLVRFTSDEADNAGGFLASFKSILPVYCSGTTTFSDSSGTFDDGSGSKKYNNSAMCKWKIIPQNLVPITLTFESFDTEPEFDFLRIYDLGTQQLVATYSGDTIPGPITIQSGKAYLVFMTNKTVTASGFTVQWEPEGTTGLSDPAPTGISVYPNPVDNELWINLMDNDAHNCILEFYDVTGSLIDLSPCGTNGNSSLIKINTESIQRGIYFIRLKGPSFVKTCKFVKQ